MRRISLSGRGADLVRHAFGATIEKDGDKWTLVVVRELRHPPTRVWEALTDPAHLAEWAPFDADRSLASVGPMTLTTIGAPKLNVSENNVRRAEAPKLLEYNWGQFDLRWELEPVGSGTRLTLWQNIDKRTTSRGRRPAFGTPLLSTSSTGSSRAIRSDAPPALRP